MTWKELIVGPALMLVASCGPRETSKVLTTNDNWKISVHGRLTRSVFDTGFPHMTVRFTAERKNALYASGALVTNDDPFFRNFPNAEWVNPNAIRMYRNPDSQVPSVQFSVNNSSAKQVKWLTLDSQDLFLVLDLPVGAHVDLRGAWWGPQTVAIAGEFVDGTPFETSGSLLTPPTVVKVTINGTSIAIDQ